MRLTLYSYAIFVSDKVFDNSAFLKFPTETKEQNLYLYF